MVSKFDMRVECLLKARLSERSPSFHWVPDDIPQLKKSTGLSEDQIQNYASIIRYIHFQYPDTEYFKIKEESDSNDVEIIFSRFYLALFNVDLSFIRKLNKLSIDFLMVTFDKNTGLGEVYIILKKKLRVNEVYRSIQDIGGAIVCIKGFNDYDGDKASVQALSRVISGNDRYDHEVYKGKCPSGLWDKAQLDMTNLPMISDDHMEDDVEFLKQMIEKLRQDRDDFETQSIHLKQELKRMGHLINENERLNEENRDLKEKQVLMRSIDRLCRLNDSLEVRIKMQEERVLKRPNTGSSGVSTVILE